MSQDPTPSTRRPPTPTARWLLVGSLELVLLLLAVGWLAHIDAVNSRPLPAPDVVLPPTDAPLDLPGVAPSGRPTLLHFVDPDCPCSRSNLDHLAALHRRFADRVRFVAVVPEGSEMDGLPAGMECVADVEGRLAAGCGVWASPHGAIVASGRLYFRGSYNRSRACTDPNNEFVRIALECLVEGRAAPTGLESDRLAWGCALPQVAPDSRPDEGERGRR